MEGEQYEGDYAENSLDTAGHGRLRERRPDEAEGHGHRERERGVVSIKRGEVAGAASVADRHRDQPDRGEVTEQDDQAAAIEAGGSRSAQGDHCGGHRADDRQGGREQPRRTDAGD